MPQLPGGLSEATVPVLTHHCTLKQRTVGGPSKNHGPAVLTLFSFCDTSALICHSCAACAATSAGALCMGRQGSSVCTLCSVMSAPRCARSRPALGGLMSTPAAVSRHQYHTMIDVRWPQPTRQVCCQSCMSTQDLIAPLLQSARAGMCLGLGAHL
jgi:hypothetical protein